MLLIVLFLVLESLPALRTIGLSRFLTDSGWSPTATNDSARFGLADMMFASLAVTAGSALLATPLGLSVAIFVVFYAPFGISGFCQKIVELMAGVPSVVYGLWGLVVLVPVLSAWQPPGTSLLAGILIVTLMILPTIALLSIAALEQVPHALIQTSASLGFSSGGTLRKVVLPAASSGIVTSILLSIARALGETMAVLMVCGNVIQMPDSVFAAVRPLTANIALEMSYAVDLHRSSLFATGLMLIVIVGCLVFVTALIRSRRGYV